MSILLKKNACEKFYQITLQVKIPNLYSSIKLPLTFKE